MKKSFKKAGAAVLSMAMLLSMGAMSMPVYAETNNPRTKTTGEATNSDVNPGTAGAAVNLPGSIHISMPGLYKQGEGDNAGPDQSASSDKYDYIGSTDPNFQITSANVSVYRVAKLDGSNGWQWEGLFSDIEDDLRTTARADASNPANIGDDVTDFSQLLKDATEDGKFDTKSEDLKKLASYLEGKILAAKEANNSAVTNYTYAASNPGILIANKTIDYKNAEDGFELPVIDYNVTGFNADQIGTKDVIGYYIIVTETDQAGVLVQPVLISLKNGKENPKNISLKGSLIDIDKNIKKVGDDAEKNNHTDKIVDSSSAVVGKNDTVHYEISAQLPKYDPNVSPSDIENFVIEDIASEGITIDRDSIKVYISTANEGNKTDSERQAAGEKADNWYLKGDTAVNSGDYSITNPTDMVNNPNGFVLTITGEQMRGKNVTTTIGQTTAPTAPDDEYTNGYNAASTPLTTMENKYILVSFDATVDAAGSHNGYKFDRSYTAPIDVSASALTLPDGVALNDVYDAWVAYANRNTTGTNTGAKEAIRAALARNRFETEKTYTSITGATITSPVTISDPATAADAAAEEQAIGLLLAIEHYNSTRNGETNYAEMTYGNKYSTGKGHAKDTTKDTTLYSVDVSLNKYAEKLALAYNATAPTWTNITMPEIQAAFDSTDETVVAAINALSPSADEITAIDTQFPTIAADTTNKTRLEKAAKYVLQQKTDEYNDAYHYNSSNIEEVVEGAVFKLVRDDGTVMGAAMSDIKDNKGVLKQLTEIFVPTGDDYGTGNTLATQAGVSTTAPSSDDVNLTFTGNKVITLLDANGNEFEKSVAGTYYYTTKTDVNAWQMLTTGTYTLTEESVPTGFKKWAADKPVTFTINALDRSFEVVDPSAATPNKYDGAYSATGSSLVPTEIASKQTEDGKGTAADPVNFKYYDEGKAQKKSTNGVLQHNIYNEYQDTLPATGGIGTVLFTAGGISIVLIAGALFVMYMKKRNAEDEE